MIVVGENKLKKEIDYVVDKIISDDKVKKPKKKSERD